VEPSIGIGSVAEMLAVATAMEDEAGRRYRQMAGRMRLQGQHTLAALFIFLAGIEERHANQLRRRSEHMIGRLPETEAIEWELPEKFEEEEGRSYLLTPFTALAIAVRNEDRAFAFFAYLAAHARTPEIRQLAEELAKDELEHAALLRRERRRAWRKERPGDFAAPADIRSFLARAAAIETFFAKAHRDLSTKLGDEGHSFEASLFEKIAGDEERCAADAVKQGATASVRPIEGVRPETIRDGLRLLEYAFDQYAEIAERANDEAVLSAAQEFQRRALERLAYAQGVLGDPLVGQ
jgi:rubrerythrin